MDITKHVGVWTNKFGRIKHTFVEEMQLFDVTNNMGLLKEYLYSVDIIKYFNYARKRLSNENKLI